MNFSSLVDAEYGPLPLAAMTRHELAASLRLNLGSAQRWQLVSTAGVSVASTPKQDDNQSPYVDHTRYYHANRNLLPAFLVSLGVAYRPGVIAP